MLIPAAWASSSHGVQHDRVDANRFGLPLLLASDRPVETANQGRSPLRGRTDGLHMGQDVRVIRARPQELGRPQNPGQDVVEIVADARGHFAKRAKPFQADQLLLHVLALRNVARNTGEAVDSPLPVAIRSHVDFNEANLSVLGLDRVLVEAPDLLPPCGSAHLPPQHFQVLGTCHHLRHVQLQDLGGAVASNPRGRFVDEGVVPLQIDREEDVAHGIQDMPVSALAVAERVLHLLPLGDVTEYPAGAQELAILEPAVHIALNHHLAAVACHEHRLDVAEGLPRADPPEQLHAVPTLVFSDDFHQVEGPDFSLGVAQDLPPPLVDIYEAAVRIDTLDQVVGILEQILQVGLIDPLRTGVVRPSGLRRLQTRHPLPELGEFLLELRSRLPGIFHVKSLLHTDGTLNPDLIRARPRWLQSR